MPRKNTSAVADMPFSQSESPLGRAQRKITRSSTSSASTATQTRQTGKRPQRRMGAIRNAYHVMASKHADPVLMQVRESVAHYNHRHTSPATLLEARLELIAQFPADALDVAVVINERVPAHTLWLSRPEGHADEGYNID